MNKLTIGERIKNLRTSLELSQEELAVAVGTKKQTIHKYETGIITNIPASKIKGMADKLGTTPAYLMGWVDNEAIEKKNDILTDIVLKLQSDDEFREITETIYNASPELLNALKAFIFAFKQ